MNLNLSTIIGSSFSIQHHVSFFHPKFFEEQIIHFHKIIFDLTFMFLNCKCVQYDVNL